MEILIKKRGLFSAKILKRTSTAWGSSGENEGDNCHLPKDSGLLNFMDLLLFRESEGRERQLILGKFVLEVQAKTGKSQNAE